MPKPLIRTKRRSFSASQAVEIAGDRLRRIKSEDNLTYAELGRILGKGKDQAERIAKGNAAMDMPTFLTACDYWGERFADDLLALVGLRSAPLGATCSTDPGTLPLATLLHQVAAAEHPESESGPEITEREARAIPEQDIRAVERLVAHLRELRKPKAAA